LKHDSAAFAIKIHQWRVFVEKHLNPRQWRSLKEGNEGPIICWMFKNAQVATMHTWQHLNMFNY